jgi:3-methyladenine DNA glycosylase/8-oxoguanine DNA glycosylase
MGTLTLDTPRDFALARDACSYGYFLLAPNYWDTRTQTLWRVLDVDGRALLAHVRQARGAGAPLKVRVMGMGGSEALSREGRQSVAAQLTRMLRLDEDEATLREFHRRDPRFAKGGRGRLFRSPTFFEDVVKTVTSCNVQWPGTIQMNRRLCEVLGAKVRVAYARSGGGSGGPRTLPEVHAFPSAQQLSRVRAQTLRARCRVGYRDARLIELARLFAKSPRRGGVDQAWFQDPSTDGDAIFKALVGLPGIGPYAAANIMQLLGRYSRLPLDTESVRHGRTVLGYQGTSAQVMRRVHEHFAPMGEHAFRSYWFELWEFYERKAGKSWTWDRDTTGKTFTAALLSK